VHRRVRGVSRRWAACSDGEQRCAAAGGDAAALFESLKEGLAAVATRVFAPNVFPRSLERAA
jgi:hypothetical protein